MKRREFIAFLGTMAIAWPVAPRAEQQAVLVVGLLSSTSASEYGFAVTAFKQGLNEDVEGRNVAIEYRWAEGQYSKLSALAADLIDHHVTVIVAIGGVAAAVAAKGATSAIPIVFNVGADPVGAGLVTSLARPDGNVTGVAMIGGELFAKRLELLRELVPQATVIAVLVNPADPKAMPETRDMQKTADALGRGMQVLKASSDTDFDVAFGALTRQQIGALVVGNDGFFNGRRARIVALAARHAVPAIYPWRTFVEAGGLMSYGASLSDAYHQVGVYAGKILQGTKPADLPVIQPAKFELVINLKTAKALGLTVPPTLLARAEVIE